MPQIWVGKYKFSPTVKSLLDRCHALKWLRRHRCKIKRGQSPKTNIENMKRFARRHGFEDSISIPINVLVDMYKLEMHRTKRMLADSTWMRSEYLNAKLQIAIDAEKG